MAACNNSRTVVSEPNSLVSRMAEKFSIDPNGLLQTLKATAFRQTGNTQITNEQMYALLIVSDQYNLNPFTKEIYAFPDKQGGIVPVVGVDGWNRISNEHSQFDGVEFVYSEEILLVEGALAPCHAWIEAVLFRKDRSRPIRVREYLDECYRAPFTNNQTGYVKNGPWQTHPKRLLRHKAEIQCYRIGFGFVGIFDEDEAYRIIEAQSEDGKKLASVVSMNSAPQKTLEHQTTNALNEYNEDAFNKEEVDAFLSKLIKRAKASHLWQAAEDLIDERLKGKAAEYAKEELVKVRSETVEIAEPYQSKEPPKQQQQVEPKEPVTTILEGEPVQMALPENAGRNYF